ncbi:MAG: hypothetical protein HY673_12535 [Chloroflexi bacterium]|nr:hypothetical protein [Chloroflexota bacterium]
MKLCLPRSGKLHLAPATAAVLLAVGVLVAAPACQFLKTGPDVRGGIELIFEADLQGTESRGVSDDDRLEQIQETVQRRIDAHGAPGIVGRDAPDRITVRLAPGGSVDEIIKVVTRPARLTFMEPVADPDGGAVPEEGASMGWKQATGIAGDGRELALTGQYVRSAVEMEAESRRRGQPLLLLEFDREGSLLLKQVTARLSLDQSPLGIFLDDELISAPLVRSVIEDKAVIENLSPETMARVVLYVNSGALAAPLKLIQRRGIP